jgi:hypothetical protein
MRIVGSVNIGKYTIRRHDERNLIVEKEERRVAATYTKNHKKGDSYLAIAFVGYYDSFTAAGRGVLKDGELDAAQHESLVGAVNYMDGLADSISREFGKHLQKEATNAT